MLLVLTFTTGLVDATSYLALGHVFTANMTGNIVFLGFGIAGSGGLPVLAPLISLGAFLVGSGVGGALAARMTDRHTRHFACAVAIEVSSIGVAAVVVGVVDVRPNATACDAVIALLALAMGVRNATVRRIAVPDLTTTVLTPNRPARQSVTAPGASAGAVQSPPASSSRSSTALSTRARTRALPRSGPPSPIAGAIVTPAWKRSITFGST
jgi:hypothetical protein